MEVPRDDFDIIRNAQEMIIEEAIKAGKEFDESTDTRVEISDDEFIVFESGSAIYKVKDLMSSKGLILNTQLSQHSRDSAHRVLNQIVPTIIGNTDPLLLYEKPIFILNNITQIPITSATVGGVDKVIERFVTSYVIKYLSVVTQVPVEKIPVRNVVVTLVHQAHKGAAQAIMQLTQGRYKVATQSLKNPAAGLFMSEYAYVVPHNGTEQEVRDSIDIFSPDILRLFDSE